MFGGISFVNTELSRKIGHLNQLAGIRKMVFSDGKAKGISIINIHNATGLKFSLLPDNCLDIYDFNYRGVNFAFQSKNGINRISRQTKDDFYTQWFGGMLSTCGLSNVGESCDDDGFHPIHGRIGCAPADFLSTSENWQNDACSLTVSGEMTDSRLYGRSLSLRRTISTELYSKSVQLMDVITNNSNCDEEFMLLYHFNFGYPLLDSTSKFFSSSSTIQSLNDYSKNHEDMCNPDEEPSHQLFLHTMHDDSAYAGLYNHELKLGAYIKFETKNLPFLCEWKHLMSNDFVLALEPSNCHVLGRANERANGTLKVLPAGEMITMNLTIGVIDGDSELNDIMRVIRK